jgi:hypothetical protein
LLTNRTWTGFPDRGRRGRDHVSWIFTLLGLLVRDPESVGIGGLLAVIPLIYANSTFVRIATFPGWLQASAKANVNPISVTVDAQRAQCVGEPTATPEVQALAWIGAVLAVIVPPRPFAAGGTTSA